MPEAKAFSKEQQLGAGRPKRYRRRVASPKRWQAILDEKAGVCRVCRFVTTPGHPAEYHHLVPRSQGGDDVADNIVPLGRSCHAAVTERDTYALRALADSLTDAEYAYVVGKLGEGALSRLFGEALQHVEMSA